MPKFTSLLLSSALVGAISLSALAPVAASAQEQVAAAKHRGQGGQEQHMQRGNQGRPGGFINLICSPDGAARLETMLSKISEKTTLSAEQQALYDTFKADLLTAQTDYADTCIAPVRGQGEGHAQGKGQAQTDKPDMMERVKMRQANMTALVAAMDEVIPSMDAFFSSLSDEQKADLRPGRDGQGQHDGQRMGKGRQGPRSNG